MPFAGLDEADLKFKLREYYKMYIINILFKNNITKNIIKNCKISDKNIEKTKQF